MLQMQILNVLVGEMTGYQIARAIKAEYGKDPGFSVYPVLRRMQRDGLVKYRVETPEEQQKRIEKDGEDVRLGARRFFYSKTHQGGTWLRDQEIREMNDSLVFGV